MRDKSSKGLVGSATTEGVGRVGGMTAAPGRSGSPAIILNTPHPAVKKAVIVWGIAVAILLVFHVGGASFSD